MSPEIIMLIMTTLGGIAAAIKAVAEARKARFEAEARIAEAKRADEAEKTTNAVIAGVERAKMTLGEANLAQYLQDEIKYSAEEQGVEGNLNKMVKKARNTGILDRSKLFDKLDEQSE
jgi:hypothetical protein